MRLLITGASGFLGSHLCQRFLATGHKVVGMDNFLTSQPYNLETLTGHESFMFRKQDVSKRFTVAGPVDAVLHFACPASPGDYMRYSIETMQVDSLGTFNALELALQKNARFVMASTSEVYGDPLIHPQVESYWGNVNPVGVRSVYDEAKRFSEALSMAYFRAHKIDVRIARIFNTYGPRMRLNDGRVVPNFLFQALQGNPITVYGDGTQTRSLCYIDDMVEGIERLTVRNGLGGQAINLGNPDEQRVIDLAYIVKELTGSASPIVFKPLPEDDPKRRCPDISKAGQLLGWSPATPLRTGLQRTLDYFRGKLQGPVAAGAQMEGARQ